MIRMISGGFIMGSSWTCPFCNRITTITEYDKKTGGIDLNLKNKYGPKRRYFCLLYARIQIAKSMC